MFLIILYYDKRYALSTGRGKIMMAVSLRRRKEDENAFLLLYRKTINESFFTLLEIQYSCAEW